MFVGAFVGALFTLSLSLFGLRHDEPVIIAGWLSVHSGLPILGQTSRAAGL
jgi:hypothetical protein